MSWIPVPVPQKQKVTVPEVPIPQSTTLPSRALPVGVLAMFIVQLYVELGDTHSAEDHLSVAAT